MISLPVAERELRVAARKPATFRLRVTSALVALVLGSVVYAFMRYMPGMGRTNPGGALFGTLAWFSLAGALSAGLFLTSDCLSEEKREGTLGLLFLTELGGFDIVSGKLLSTSLRAFYGLLALFPILALGLLMGGVTGMEFWRSSLALANALFVSLASALFISALSRDAQRALSGAMALLIVLAAAGPMCDSAIAQARRGVLDPFFSLSSPVYLFNLARSPGRAPFWTGLLINQVFGWVLFGVACYLAPRTWQAKTSKLSGNTAGWIYRWKFGGSVRRLSLRKELLSINPVLWLSCRERWQSVLLWIVSLFLAAGAIGLAMVNQQSTAWFLWNYFAGAVSMILYVGAASQGSRFFVDLRRSGLLELFLVTPMTVREIVGGHWRAFFRLFGLPLALYLGVHLFGTVMGTSSWSQMAVPPVSVTTTTRKSVNLGTNHTTITQTTTVGPPPGPGPVFTPAPNPWSMIGISVMGTLAFLANLGALVWVGMWMGLTAQNLNVATLKTILFVQIIPWFVISFASAMLIPILLFSKFKLLNSPNGLAFSQYFLWVPLIMAGISTMLSLGKDAAFYHWARKKLHAEFRDRASRTSGVIFSPVPPLLPVPPLAK